MRSLIALGLAVVLVPAPSIDSALVHVRPPSFSEQALPPRQLLWGAIRIAPQPTTPLKWRSDARALSVVAGLGLTVFGGVAKAQQELPLPKHETPAKKQSIDDLIKQLNDSPHWEKTIDELTAASRLDPGALPKLTAVLANKDSSSQQLGGVLRTLGTLKDPRTVMLLLPLLDQPVGNVRQTVVQLLGELKDRRATLALVHLFSQDVGLDLQCSILDSLGSIGDPRARDTVRTAVGSVDPTLREVGVNAAGALKFYDLVVPFLKDTEFSLRYRAIQALDGATESILVQPLVDFYRHETNSNLRQEAFNRLSHLIWPASIAAHVGIDSKMSLDLRAAALKGFPWQKIKPTELVKYFPATGLRRSIAARFGIIVLDGRNEQLHAIARLLGKMPKRFWKDAHVIAIADSVENWLEMSREHAAGSNYLHMIYLTPSLSEQDTMRRLSHEFDHELYPTLPVQERLSFKLLHQRFAAQLWAVSAYSVVEGGDTDREGIETSAEFASCWVQEPGTLFLQSYVDGAPGIQRMIERTARKFIMPDGKLRLYWPAGLNPTVPFTDVTPPPILNFNALKNLYLRYLPVTGHPSAPALPALPWETKAESVLRSWYALGEPPSVHYVVILDGFRPFALADLRPEIRDRASALFFKNHSAQSFFPHSQADINLAARTIVWHDIRYDALNSDLRKTWEDLLHAQKGERTSAEVAFIRALRYLLDYTLTPKEAPNPSLKEQIHFVEDLLRRLGVGDWIIERSYPIHLRGPSRRDPVREFAA